MDNSGWLLVKGFFVVTSVCLVLYQTLSQSQLCKSSHLWFLATSHHYRGKNRKKYRTSFFRRRFLRDRNVKVNIVGLSKSIFYTNVFTSLENLILAKLCFLIYFICCCSRVVLSASSVCPCVEFLQTKYTQQRTGSWSVQHLTLLLFILYGDRSSSGVVCPSVCLCLSAMCLRCAKTAEWIALQFDVKLLWVRGTLYEVIHMIEIR